MTSPLSDELALGIEAYANRSWDIVFVHCTLQYCLPQFLMNIISALKHSNKHVRMNGALSQVGLPSFKSSCTVRIT